jgi:hypothetical protein
MGDSGGSMVSVDVERISFGGKVPFVSPLNLVCYSCFLPYTATHHVVGGGGLNAETCEVGDVGRVSFPWMQFHA